MTFPKMILFDYGKTLMCEPGYNTQNGDRAVFKYVKTNRYNITAEELNACSDRLFQELRIVRHSGYELNERQFERFLYEYCGVELSISLEEAERIFWYGVSPGEIMPGTHELLAYLNNRGIRTGVISNIMFTGAALTERLNRFFPKNRFEFILASSDYIFRKPNPLIFELALKKAGLPASDIWFCGDNPTADVMGASGAGIFPVWYNNEKECFYCNKASEETPSCEHLHIREWSELIEFLENLGGTI